MKTVEDDPLPLRVDGRLGMEGTGEAAPETEEAELSDSGLIKSLNQKISVDPSHEQTINLPNSSHPLEPLSLTSSSHSFHAVGIKQLEGAQFIH